MYTVQYYKSQKKKSGQAWFIRIIAKNGKIVADGGEPYSTASNAKRACIRLIGGIPTAIIEKSK